MATRGTEKVLGGTPYKRYPDPASPGTANAQGLYPWSVFKATVCDFNGIDVPTPIPDLSNYGIVYLLLFTSDVPAILEFRATDTGTNLQFSAGAVNGLTFPALYTTVGQNGTPAKIQTQGKVIAGYTGALGDVYCTGFPAEGNAVAPGPSGTATYTEVICVANAPVIASPVSSLSLSYKQQNNIPAPVPVIIRWDSYTAAMRDAGNLITTNNGSLYQIVGLWAA